MAVCSTTAFCKRLTRLSNFKLLLREKAIGTTRAHAEGETLMTSEPYRRSLFKSGQAIRRRRISRAAVPGRLTPDHAPPRRGDREALRCRKGVHRPAEALDC